MITVYSQPNCSPCVKVKKWLDNKGVEYVDKDVTTDPEAFAELMGLGYNSTPVVSTPTRAWAGIDLAKMKSLTV